MNTRSFLTAAAFAGLALGIITGCGGKDEFKEVAVTPVSQLYEPAADRYMPLNPSGSAYFEWERATAADNGIVYYEVLFDRAGGDFSNPLYVQAADNYGTSNGATVSHRLLSRIAGYTGAEASQECELDWRVRSSRGLTSTMGTATRRLRVVRLAGVNSLEGSPLLMAGEGSEVGQRFRELTEAQYEIYTRLEADKPYYFTSDFGGTIRTFTIGDGGSFRETGEPAADITVPATGVYRINLDFDIPSASVVKVDKVEIFNCWTQLATELAYQGVGVWKRENYNIVLASTSWGFDERYKFIFTVDGVKEGWGQKGPYQDNRQDVSNSAYRYMSQNNDGNAQFGENLFKFPNQLCDASNLSRYFADVVVRMTAEGEYTHDFENIH